MGDADTIPVWRKLYQIVSGSNEHVNPSLVGDILNICKTKANVLLSYKVYTKESFEEFKQISKSMLISQDDVLVTLIHRMSKELDLDVTLAWSLICNFLIFDYCGKVDDLKSIVCYEANIKSLIDQLWNFYTSDRMFLLKTFRFIFENFSDEECMYHRQFKSFVEGIDQNVLYRNVLDNFEYLLTEIDTEKSRRVSEDILPQWLRRNNREQVEMLLFMIQILDIIKVNGGELIDIIKLFMKHGFGRHPLFFGAETLSRPKDIVEIQNAEIGVIFTLVNKYWQNPGNFSLIPNQIEKDFEQCQLRGDNGTILFIWVVFKSTLSDNYLDYSRNMLELLLKKKVFKSLADFLTLNVFQNCKAGEIIINATNRLLIELLQFVDDSRFIYEQEGVVKIMCELYKRPHLNALCNFGVFFEIALDMFPYILDNFLDMVESIIIYEDHYTKVMRLLHNCKTYCTELPWPYSSDAVKSTEERNLFEGSNKFIIPAGTLTERCNCFGFDVVKFHYKFDFFEVIEQFMRSLTMWALSSGDYNKFVLSYVLRANKFICVLIKYYRGNFKKDKIIRPLLQRLDCVPTYYSKCGFKSYEFFSVYFETKCALVKYQNVDFNEAFPPMIRKILFPPVTDFQNAMESLRAIQASNDSVLYEFLKEEESSKDHKLLLEYIEIILDVLKKDMLYAEVTFSGVWYILYVIFPDHRNWVYDEDDPFQKVKIVNGCLQVFIEVLQADPADLKSIEQKGLYKLVHNSFLNDAYIISSFYNLFVKDRFYLPNIMHQESNWVAGKTLIVQNTIKLELIVLLLVFKCRAKIPNIRCEIDESMHDFAKSASIYFISPYNCTLAVLAGRFLEILGRNENIPLMSCLGLDYDQIQTLFLERLRDPMEDEAVKLNILDIIGTCVLHQTGMTAAFFNIQSSKKWYNPDVKKLEGDTVADFMMDYLKNIRKSVAYLRSPLQAGILKVMANLWDCQKQHLIKDLIESKDFWVLIVDPLLKPFDQAPLVYFHLLKILTIQLTISLKNPDGQESLFKAVGKFLCDQKQLRLFQQYLLKIFLNKDLSQQGLHDRELLIQAWSELLVTIQKQDTLLSFPNSECQYLYIDLAFDVFQISLVHQNILSTWLDFSLVVFDMFGLKFEQRLAELSQKAVEYTKVIKLYYPSMSIRDKRTTLTIILKIIQELKSYYEDHTLSLFCLLEEIGPLLDLEYFILEEDVWKKFKAEDLSARELLGPWALFISIANIILTLENCKEFAIWFSSRRYLDKVIECTSELLSYKAALSAGKVALYSLTLYVQSPLAYDFLTVNMVKFYDRIEPMVNELLTGQQNKVDLLDLKDAWLLFNLIVKFSQAFLERFQKKALEACYAFLTINEHIIKHIMNLPENTVDFRALDLLTQTLIFYHEILKNWKIEWYRKSNKTFTLMTDGLRKVINACIYLCLRPKHIGFYYLNKYFQLVPEEEESKSINDLMISVINRLIGILSLAFSCLYQLNSNLLELFDYFEPEESIIVLIQNDFSVPRFELPIPCDLTYGKLLCLAHFLCKTMNQLHGKNSGKSREIDEKQYAFYIGLVEHQNPSDIMPDQKLSSFLRYIYEYSGLIDPWINNLNYKNVQRTADMLMLFLAQQAFLTIRILEPHQVPYYKRNLYSELQFFNEYVTKRTSEIVIRLNSSSPHVYTGDMDYIKRYLLSHWKKNEKDFEKDLIWVDVEL